MTKLTDKQHSFVTHKVAGCTNRDAAIAAGYAPGSAAQAGDRLTKHPAVRAAIKAATKEAPSVATMPAMPRKHYADPMTFLQDVMNHAQLPIAMRADAAKQLLPYQHARLGEQGKKQKAKDRAKEVAGAPRFGTKVAPPMRIITGGKGQRELERTTPSNYHD